MNPFEMSISNMAYYNNTVSWKFVVNQAQLSWLAQFEVNQAQLSWLAQTPTTQFQLC